jgi:hypothetical protein
MPTSQDSAIIPMPLRGLAEKDCYQLSTQKILTKIELLPTA